MNYIVFDFGGTEVKAAAMDEKGNIRKRWKTKSPTGSRDAFVRIVDEIVSENSDGRDGIALSMPGKIDPVKGNVIRSGSFRFFRDTPLKNILEEKYRCPVSVNNDAKCAAMAELCQGEMQNICNGLVYVLGTAVGGGLIIDGKVAAGPHFTAGEFSNCLIDLNGGGFSLENALVHKGSTRGMLKEYQRRKKADQMADGYEFFEKILSGDEEAEAVFREFCRCTASFFFTLQMALDMERICIGGGISEQPVVISAVREELHRLFEQLNAVSGTGIKEPEIVKCRFGNDANLVGALQYLLEYKKEMKRTESF